MKAAGFIRRHPLPSYFLLAYLITWLGVLAAVGPRYIQGEDVQLTDGLIMLAAMLAGPSIAGLTCARIVDGEALVEGFRSYCSFYFNQPGSHALPGFCFIAISKLLVHERLRSN